MQRNPVKTARLYMEAGEYYKARKIAEKALGSPNQKDHDEAEKLMAQILDREIAQQKNILEDKVPEELTKSEKKVEIETWLERSKAFMELRLYEQALLAAEKVFIFDPYNSRASRLIDEVNDRAEREGNSEALQASQVTRQEVEDRLYYYREQATAWMKEGQWGGARLAIEKGLILAPDDPELNRLSDQLRRKMRSGR